jgi:hypothetical protein
MCAYSASVKDKPLRYWIGAASRDHVMKGKAAGFCQLGHGKAAPVKRLQPCGPYASDMGGGFVPARRVRNDRGGLRADRRGHGRPPVT